MKPRSQHGVWDDGKDLWTQNRVPGHRTYGEKLSTRKGTEYRRWSLYRSKMAALVRRVQNVPWPKASEDILYLGASTGTTVSHMSDLCNGLIYAVEFSPRSMRDLVWNAEPRNNVIPILEDAGRPERYAPYIEKPVGCIIQDVAQRNQLDIFMRNVKLLKPGGLGYLMVKARSIDVARSPDAIYADVRSGLLAAGLEVICEADLEPFERDHRAFVIRSPNVTTGGAA